MRSVGDFEVIREGRRNFSEYLRMTDSASRRVKRWQDEESAWMAPSQFVRGQLALAPLRSA